LTKREYGGRTGDMDRPGYFQTALSNFATEVACGGAVRHLADIGYTLNQICDRLDYPAPRSKVQRIMMEHLYERRILLREEPSMEIFAGQTRFVQEQNAYGRRSLRRVRDDFNSQNTMTNASDLTLLPGQQKEAYLKDILWKEVVYERGRNGKLTELLHRKCAENSEENSYMSCAFSFLNYDQNSQNLRKEKPDVRETGIGCLNNRQREYLLGIRWEEPVVYHRLNQRMREILVKLYEAGSYEGACFFLKTQEKLILIR